MLYEADETYGQSSVSEISDKFDKNRIRFCKKSGCKVILRTCYSADLPVLRQRIEEKSGCSVELCRGECNIWGF